MNRLGRHWNLLYLGWRWIRDRAQFARKSTNCLVFRFFPRIGALKLNDKKNRIMNLKKDNAFLAWSIKYMQTV